MGILEGAIFESSHFNFMENEIWKPVKGWEGVYEVSSCGRVKKCGRFLIANRKWKGDKIVYTKRDKYERVILLHKGRSQSISVHRLVAINFINNPENKPQVNHKDLNKYNNNVSNLEWCTQSENISHAISHGKYLNINSKLTEEKRKYIKDNFLKIDRKKLAAQFGVSEKVIYLVGTNADGRGEKIHLRDIGKHKKIEPYRLILNTQTGVFYTYKELELLLSKTQKNIYRMISGERKPNKSSFIFV